jgi:hypothetical protein
MGMMPLVACLLALAIQDPDVPQHADDVLSPPPAAAPPAEAPPATPPRPPLPEPPPAVAPAAPPAQASAATPTVADEVPEERAPLGTGFGLGFAAGATSGIGLAYRHHFENGFGVGVAGIGWGDKNNVFADVGVTGTYTFARAWLVRFYALAGSMGFYNGSNVYGCIPEKPGDPTCVEETRWENRFVSSTGAGIGMEFHFTEHIGLALELPISVWLSFDATGFRADETRVLPVPNGALTYYF